MLRGRSWDGGRGRLCWLAYIDGDMLLRYIPFVTSPSSSLPSRSSSGLSSPAMLAPIPLSTALPSSSSSSFAKLLRLRAKLRLPQDWKLFLRLGMRLPIGE